MKKKTIPNTINKEAVLTETYETEIEFTCPVRGLVKQKVKVKKYAGIEQKPVVDIRPSTSITDQLDAKHSGLMLGDQDVDDDEKVN